MTILTRLRTKSNRTANINDLNQTMRRTILLMSLSNLQNKQRIHALSSRNRTIIRRLLYKFTVGLILNNTQRDSITLSNPRTLTTLIMLKTQGTLNMFLSTTTLSFLSLLSSLSISTIQIMSMTIKIKSNSSLNTRLLDLLDNMNNRITKTKSRSNLTLRKIITRRTRNFLNMMTRTMANNLNTNRKTTRFRALANRSTKMLITSTLMLTRRMTSLAAASISITNKGINRLTSITTRLDRRNLTRTRSLDIKLTLQIRIKATLTTTRQRHNRKILRGLLRTGRLSSKLNRNQIRT